MKQNENFEDFLQQASEPFRLPPNEKVWDSIRSAISISQSPSFCFKIIFPLILVFCHIWIPTGERHQNKNLPILLSKQETASQEIKIAFSNQRSSSLGIASNPKTSLKQTDAKETDLSLITHSIPHNPQAPAFLAYPLASLTKPHLKKLKNLSASNPSAYAEKMEAQSKKENHAKRKIQIHFAPSISYRVMYVGAKPLFSNGGSEPENQVGHLPATGFEAGIAVSRPVAKRWTLRTGVQFNFSRYKINAAKEQTNWVYVNLYANNNSMLSRDQEVKKQQLMNENLQVSFPVAIEYCLLEHRRASFLLAASIQPSWVLHASGHMISTNYNKYVPVENLYRKYNVNGGIECLVNIKAGLIDFQAGPQIRYQLLSNTTGSYPVKEHLVDYGFKVGITKTL